MVDDRPANLLALEATLESPELDLVRARSGDEALRLALSREFDLILLDVQMPGLGGLETARLLKQRPSMRATPIIFLSAEAPTPEEVEGARQLGAADYLVKPFDVETLRAKVHSALAPVLARLRASLTPDDDRRARANPLAGEVGFFFRQSRVRETRLCGTTQGPRAACRQ